MDIVTEIALAALIGAMQQVSQHYFPWPMIFRRELPRVPAYVMGTLAYLVPVTVVYAHWELSNSVLPEWAHLAALWASVVASGAAVVLVRFIDWAMGAASAIRESGERENELMQIVEDIVDGQGKSV